MEKGRMGVVTSGAENPREGNRKTKKGQKNDIKMLNNIEDVKKQIMYNGKKKRNKMI